MSLSVSNPCKFFALMSLANFKLTSWMAIAHCFSPSIPPQPGAFTAMQKPFAFEFSRVSRDRKMNFLPSRLGEIQSRKIGHRPLRTGVKVMPGAGVHQGKLHLPWNVGAPDGPVAALCIAAESLRDTQYDAGDHQD